MNIKRISYADWECLSCTHQTLVIHGENSRGTEVVVRIETEDYDVPYLGSMLRDAAQKQVERLRRRIEHIKSPFGKELS